MHTSHISIDIHLGQDKVPDKINWKASDSSAEEMQESKAMMVSFWDGSEKNAMRIDLWTKKMMVDEMADFFYQSFMGMADAYDRATHAHPEAESIRLFAKEFYRKFRENQLKENKGA